MTEKEFERFIRDTKETVRDWPANDLRGKMVFLAGWFSGEPDDMFTGQQIGEVILAILNAPV